MSLREDVRIGFINDLTNRQGLLINSFTGETAGMLVEELNNQSPGADTYFIVTDQKTIPISGGNAKKPRKTDERDSL